MLSLLDDWCLIRRLITGCLIMLIVRWYAKLGTFYFPLLFMRSGWRIQCWCSCRLACNLLHSFQSHCWGWVWMVLWILMLISIFYCTAGKLERCQNLRGPFTLSLDCNGSEVNCNSVVVDRYIVSFDMTDRYCSWKWFCAGLAFWDASLGVSTYAVSTVSTDGLFFARGFLRGMRADKTLDAPSSRSSWFGDRLHLPVRGPRPYRFGSDNRGCSRTNAWQFSTFPRRRLPALSKASTVFAGICRTIFLWVASLALTITQFIACYTVGCALNAWFLPLNVWRPKE